MRTIIMWFICYHELYKLMYFVREFGKLLRESIPYKKTQYCIYVEFMVKTKDNNIIFLYEIPRNVFKINSFTTHGYNIHNLI